MKGRKLWVPLGLTTALVAGSVLSGCGSDKATNGSAQGNAGSNGAPVKLQMAMAASGLPAPDADDIKKTIDQKLNVDLQLTAIASGDDYKSQIRVRLSGGNFPDLFSVDFSDVKEFADKGLLLDLTPYMDKELKGTKDFVVGLTPNILKKVTVNGKMYAVPRTADVPFSSMWVRKDWLEKLSLKTPTNLEEFLTVAKAFTEQDPDGNGKKDTYGMTGAKLDSFATIFGAYGVGQPGTFYQKDGKVMNAYYDPAMPDALKYIKSLFDAGVVDPEIMTNKGNVEVQKAFQGKAGLIFKGWTDIAKDEFVAQYKAINPKADWVQMNPVKGPGGQYDGTYDYDRPSRYWVIPKALEKDKAKLQKVFDLINYVSGKEGNTLVMYGLEGKHYNMKNGKLEPTDLMAKEGNYFNLYQITGRPNKEYLAIKFPNQAAATEFAIKTPRISTFDSSVIPPSGFNKADADRFAEEEMIKFVTGKRPISEYADFLKTLETTFKYKTYVDEGAKQIKEQGFVK
ncbi:extracellular solute-binding protein [Paenibacillus hemerocallicola]|jgi:putative aldouronate transport system substrate-binding protein|uniref:Extracellular solute-binding protein n=1 Tax=Paenibacillus hemerocallicola TaxID=1172614 RepID=A0A5C4SV77_9BACL|nr:extracellular solute-binding protein [Paenibacillus hemerocallicola]TNJ55214.1 extracellular solute-binding protein [Paenibacillus hemerocallicola]